MKNVLSILLSIVLVSSCSHEESTEVINDKSQNSLEAKEVSDNSETQEAPKTETNFNAELAKELSADDYGMHQYVMAFLKAGPNRTNDKEEAAKLQRAHLDNITKMAEEGVLVLAGPFMDDGDIRGIYVFDVHSIEEAEKLTATDPAIKAGSLVMELHPWYGSAALMKVNDIHSQIAKINI